MTIGKRLASVSSRAAWALGHWLLYGEHTSGDRYRTTVKATNLDYPTLRNYA